MTEPRILTGLSQIAERYDVLLCDVWGVIHNGHASFPEACEALVRFQTERGPVILISNAPRPSAAVHSQLDMLGVPRAAWSDFVSSGDATRALIAERAPGPAWKIGAARDNVLYDGLGLGFAGPQDAAFISCAGLENDEVETPEDYRQRLQVAADRGLTMICANPDRMVHRGSQLIFCGGALADLYETLGGKVVMAGKPYAAIYDLCLARAEQLRPSPRILCIGDGLATDVKGAQDAGLDCLFIAGGIHGSELATPSGGIDAARLELLLASQDAVAAFAMSALSW